MVLNGRKHLTLNQNKEVMKVLFLSAAVLFPTLEREKKGPLTYMAKEAHR